MDHVFLKNLTEDEREVIENKGTEVPYTGEYNDFDQQGTYLCRRCSTPLYRSKDKFKSGCGWPSFDDAIDNRVERRMDADGSRTEILCATCGAHLGHVFEGEGLTAKDTRHCVNSLSMRFVPEVVEEAVWEIATLGGGCFWCLESVCLELKGVVHVMSGYMGGKRWNPSYEQVSTGATGHVEVIQVIFDPKIITFRTLLQVFFSMHNPTTLNRQGNDVGTQYASVIFFHTQKQEQEAMDTIRAIDAEHLWDEPIVTQLRPAQVFWKAEEYHQDYFNKNPTNTYCQLMINPKLKHLKESWSAFLKEGV